MFQTIEDIIAYYSKPKEDKPTREINPQYENHAEEWLEEDKIRRFKIKNPNYREEQVLEELEHIEGLEEE